MASLFAPTHVGLHISRQLSESLTPGLHSIRYVTETSTDHLAPGWEEALRVHTGFVDVVKVHGLSASTLQSVPETPTEGRGQHSSEIWIGYINGQNGDLCCRRIAGHEEMEIEYLGLNASGTRLCKVSRITKLEVLFQNYLKSSSTHETSMSNDAANVIVKERDYTIAHAIMIMILRENAIGFTLKRDRAYFSDGWHYPTSSSSSGRTKPWILRPTEQIGQGAMSISDYRTPRTGSSELTATYRGETVVWLE